MNIRAGSVADLPEVLRLGDEAVEWLVARGRAAQWGAQPWSQDPERVQRVSEQIQGGDLQLAEVDGAVVGALILGERVPYVPPVDEPELYLVLLLASRQHRGVGAALIEFALAEARRRGVSVVRVDCWSGGDGKLVEYYRGQGFTPTVEVPVRDTTVQVFERRL
ncbi:GNAT superfamily N-acetyltransferase [Amycolatopsis bartoniae]|uniref:GCN5 family N-acetyltransferase n=1 Tax=Amycolatopsis bartoniae TaxID=941986 RepID=A0A8H9IV31_9PSEU|nr:GNAT family N-acetyltransferase [Amycolatopsis bartoniae]MBB2934503.1 GNAT superfamily N-acetyltransferase [Amycolatopsis bartoniae]TVT01881.1 GNAT family N-acetyltransferase [Amycolatopsis bartoniae]GHF46911.1 GCN5 family N-acetyltransferase [Amycolatopsis bartoniae]